jgi:hypothetical protein
VPNNALCSIKQTVFGCDFDEDLEQGVRCKSSITTHEIRVYLRKILQQNFPKRRSSRYWSINLLASHIHIHIHIHIHQKILLDYCAKDTYPKNFSAQ